MQINGGNMTQYSQALDRAVDTAGDGTSPKIRARNPVRLTADQLPQSFVFPNRMALLPAGTVPRSTIFPNRFVQDQSPEGATQQV